MIFTPYYFPNPAEKIERYTPKLPPFFFQFLRKKFTGVLKMIKLGCFVYRANKPDREVKNLRWLLRHNNTINFLEVGNVVIDGKLRHVLRAVSDTWRYEALFLDIRILHSWLNRPVFRGLPLYWLGTKTTVANKLDYQLLLELILFQPTKDFDRYNA